MLGDDDGHEVGGERRPALRVEADRLLGEEYDRCDERELVPRVHEPLGDPAHTEAPYPDGAGEIGVISSVTQPFCGDCSRARLSAEGKLYTCLFAAKGTDLRALLRDGADDAELDGVISEVWGDRDDRYSEIRSSRTANLPRVEMSYIGG